VAPSHETLYTLSNPHENFKSSSLRSSFRTGTPGGYPWTMLGQNHREVRWLWCEGDHQMLTLFNEHLDRLDHLDSPSFENEALSL